MHALDPSIPTTVTVNNCTFESGWTAINLYDALLSIGEATFTLTGQYGHAISAISRSNEENVMAFIQDGYKAYVDGELYTKTNTKMLGDAKEGGCVVVEITDKNYVSNPTITELDAPIHGKDADYTASTGDPNCEVTKIRYVMFKKPLDPYVGSNGDNIGIEVTVKAAGGYSFPKVAKATWNKIESFSATRNAAGNECIYLFPYTVGVDTDSIVSALRMTVETPVAGKAPATTATVNEGIRLESLTWEPADSVFKEGVSYTVTGYFWPEDTLVFRDDIVDLQRGTVNGQQAVLTKPTTGGIKDKYAKGVYVSYTFPALTAPDSELSEVSVTGIDAPVIGAEPDTTAEVASGDYTVNMVAWSPGDDKIMEPGTAFEAGKTYTVGVHLKAAEGNTFANATAATLNGQTATTIRDDETLKDLIPSILFTPTIPPDHSPALTSFV